MMQTNQGNGAAWGKRKADESVNSESQMDSEAVQKQRQTSLARRHRHESHAFGQTPD